MRFKTAAKTRRDAAVDVATLPESSRAGAGDHKNVWIFE